MKLNLTTSTIVALSTLFIACQQGLDGADGMDGRDGQDGADGLNGVNGTNGTDGVNGVNGVDGQDGADGQDGLDGVDGQDGLDGIDGQDGLDGQDGIDGIDGQDGQDGIDGTDGEDGHDGRDGHSGSGPYGVNLDIVSVDGGSGANGEIQVGDYLDITFSISDDDGVDYDLSEMSSLYFMVSGPTTHPQMVISYKSVTDVKTTATYNYDGTYTYMMAVPVPSTFAAPLNDTTDLDEDDGDWGGLAIDSDIDGDGVDEIDGTFIVGGVASITQYDDAGDSWAEADNDYEFVLGGAASTLTERTVVLEENCQGCHGDDGFRMHGGSRQDLVICSTCHVDGAEDRYSATDSTVTPGVTVGLKSMIHKIHMGADLENGIEIAGYPGDSTATGYPDYNLYDFSDVVFPSFAMAAADCEQCHDGGDGSNYTNPSRQACGSCHDGVDFTETSSSADSYHDGGPMSSDAVCSLCHTESVLQGYHQDPRDDDDTWADGGHAAGKTGLNVEVLSVTDQTGDTVLDVGDTITVTFSVLYDDGTPVPQSFFAYSSTSSTCPTISGAGTVIFTGPTDHMTRVMYSPSAGSSTVVGSVYGSSTVDTTTGIWTYSFANTDASAYTIPSTYPEQVNDSSTLLAGADYGGWYGEALVDGTYRVAVAMYTTHWNDYACGTDATRFRSAATGYMDVLFGGATSVDERYIVDDVNCEACHDRIEFHGKSRIGTDYCVMCHTVGSVNSSTTPDDTLDFKSMIHKIHGNEMLVNGFTARGSSFDFGFPRQDGGVAACEACHEGSDAYLDPSTAACVTCHDSDDTKAHAAIMTDDVYGESCDTCHDESSVMSVESVHEFTK